MAIAADDVILLSIRGKCFGQRIILTHTVRATVAFPEGQSTAAQLQSLAGGILGNSVSSIMETYLNLLPNSYSLEEVRCQVIAPIRSAYQSAFSVDDHGTHAGAASVASDAAALTLRTRNSGRNQVATKHIGPVPDSASVGGLLTTPYKALLGQLANELIVTEPWIEGGVALQPVIFHGVGNNVSEVFNARIGNESRVERRRTVGLGE